jgi:hypothetical protein
MGLSFSTPETENVKASQPKRFNDPEFVPPWVRYCILYMPPQISALISLCVDPLMFVCL